MRKKLFIIGGESTALEIRETVDICNNDYDEIVNVVADGKSCSYSYIEDKRLENALRKCDCIYYILGFTSLKLKNKYKQIFSKYGGQLVNIIHPTAFVAPSVKMGVGNYIAPLAVVSSEVVLGDSNIINLSVNIGHNCELGNDNVLNPGTKISGFVKIGNGCLFGSNSFIYQGVAITSYCKIDALTYIKKSIDTPSICSSYMSPKVFANIFNR